MEGGSTLRCGLLPSLLWQLAAVVVVMSWQLLCSVLSLAYSPDGRSLAIATLNGHISVIDVESEDITRTIEGRHDLGYTRREGDKITAKKSADAKSVAVVVS